MPRTPDPRSRRLGALLVAVTLSACARGRRVTPPREAPVPSFPLIHTLIPTPVTAELTPSEQFVVDSTTTVVIDERADPDVQRIATVLVGILTPSVKPVVA